MNSSPAEVSRQLCRYVCLPQSLLQAAHAEATLGEGEALIIEQVLHSMRLAIAFLLSRHVWNWHSPQVSVQIQNAFIPFFITAENPCRIVSISASIRTFMGVTRYVLWCIAFHHSWSLRAETCNKCYLVKRPHNCQHILAKNTPALL